MKKITTALLALSCLLSLPPGSSFAQDKKDIPIDKSRPAEVIQFDYEVGTTYLQQVGMVQSMNMNIGGQNMSQKMDIEMDMSLAVSKGEKADHKNLAITYDRMAMDMGVAGQQMKYDSANPDPENPIGKSLDGLLNQAIEMVVDSSNEIVEVKGLEEFRGNPIASQFVNEDAIKNSLNMWMTESFPKTAVKAGDKWDMDVEMPAQGLGMMKVSGKYHLAGHTLYRGSECLVIDFDSTMSLVPEEPGSGEAESNPQKQMMKAMGMKLEGGQQKGRLFWDNSLKYFRGMELDQSFTMQMKDPTGSGQQMEIPITQTITSSVDVK